jgi:hypothetical protein
MRGNQHSQSMTAGYHLGAQQRLRRSSEVFVQPDHARAM